MLAAVPASVLARVRPSEPPIPRTASFEATLLNLGQWTALALAAWLLATHLLYTLAVVTNIQWAEQILRPITLPIVRRIAASATSAVLTLSVPIPPAFANPRLQVEVHTAYEEGLRMEATPTPILEPVTTPLTVATLPPAGSYSAPLTWLVRPGDHLWKIAGDHLEIVMNRTPTEQEHSRYWAVLVNTARPVIRSGDPDLIYPGEQIPLPALLDADIRP